MLRKKLIPNKQLFTILNIHVYVYTLLKENINCRISEPLMCSILFLSYSLCYCFFAEDACQLKVKMYESEENVLLRLKGSVRGRKKEALSGSDRMGTSKKQAPTILVHSPEPHIKQTTEHKQHSYGNNRLKTLLSFSLFMLECVFYFITGKILNKLFKDFLYEHLNSAS